MGVFEQLDKVFWPAGPKPNIWAVFDSARDKKLYQKIAYSGLLYECLFAGYLPAELQRTAPYLVQLEQDDRASRKLLEESWDNSWCVFLDADVGIKTLRKHLRTLLRVQGPSGKYMLFRYYDPRVLRVYLPTCRADELERFYGPIDRIWMEEGLGSTQMLEFEVKKGKLEKKVFEAYVPDAVAAPAGDVPLVS